MNAGDYAGALALRGAGFESALRTLRTIVQALPHPPAPEQKRFRFAIMHGGGPAPGMNTAVRAAVRLLLDRGHHVLGVRNAVRGLVEGDVFEMGWMSVNGWASRGGAELGTNRRQPGDRDLYQIARQIEEQQARRAADDRRLVGLRRGRQARRRARALPGLRPADRLPARLDRQQPARLGARGRQRHRAQQHRGRRRQDQDHGRRLAALLRGRGDGAALRLPGAALGLRHRRRARLPARGRRHARRPAARPRAAEGALPGRQAPRAADPQRGGEPVLHDALPVRALRAGGRRALRRAPGDPGPPAAGRRPDRVRPHPRDAARRALASTTWSRGRSRSAPARPRSSGSARAS